MLSYLRYKLELREIAKHEKNLAKREPRNTKEAHESGQMASYVEASIDLYEWRRIALTDYYRTVADRLMVPMPPVEDQQMYKQVGWDKNPRQPRYLTDKGFTSIRNAVREEQKHRREVKAFWLTWVTGLGGMLIGVISVWTK